ncbi:MAG TPA: hypothetical protein H9985_07615 [Candidatus Anaerofilum faecale]|nr:hypothetical protein [Candidatus Anaerofilum faecale]
MKKAFLIDFENVKSAGLAGLEQLDAADDVVILYSANSNTLSFEMHQKILQSPACVDYYQIRRGGKNSLDFQLSSLLGYLLGTGDYSHLYVVSNDSGFDVLRDFWTSDFVPTECVVYRRGSIAACLAHSLLIQTQPSVEQPVPQPEPAQEEPAPVPAEETAPAPAAEEEQPAPAPEQGPAAQPEEQPQPERRGFADVIEQALPAALRDAVDEETRKKVAAALAKAQGKQDFYRRIIGSYGQKKGLEIYKTVKSEYTNLKKILEGK